MIDPDDQEALKNAIHQSLNDLNFDPLTLQQKVIKVFGFDSYKNRLHNYLVGEAETVFKADP